MPTGRAPARSTRAGQLSTQATPQRCPAAPAAVLLAVTRRDLESANARERGRARFARLTLGGDASYLRVHRRSGHCVMIPDACSVRRLAWRRPPSARAPALLCYVGSGRLAKGKSWPPHLHLARSNRRREDQRKLSHATARRRCLCSRSPMPAAKPGSGSRPQG